MSGKIQVIRLTLDLRKAKPYLFGWISASQGHVCAMLHAPGFMFCMQYPVYHACIFAYFPTPKLPNSHTFSLSYCILKKVRGKSEKIEQVFAIRICIIYNIIKKIASDLPLMSVRSFDNMFV
jgi:hypothetical protein